MKWLKAALVALVRKREDRGWTGDTPTYADGLRAIREITRRGGAV